MRSKQDAAKAELMSGQSFLINKASGDHWSRTDRVVREAAPFCAHSPGLAWGAGVPGKAVASHRTPFIPPCTEEAAAQSPSHCN